MVGKVILLQAQETAFTVEQTASEDRCRIDAGPPSSCAQQSKAWASGYVKQDPLDL